MSLLSLILMLPLSLMLALLSQVKFLHTCVRVCYFYSIFFISDPADVLKKAPDKIDVVTLLANLSARWKTIGLALRVDSNTLDGLSLSLQPNSDKLADVIGAWISAKPSLVTWKTLIKAIEGPLLQNKAKADEIRAHLGLPH